MEHVYRICDVRSSRILVRSKTGELKLEALLWRLDVLEIYMNLEYRSIKNIELVFWIKMNGVKCVFHCDEIDSVLFVGNCNASICFKLLVGE